jgi:hypothetical protein
MADRPLSLWHDTLPDGDDLTPRPPLPGDRDTDVAIVGAGFTGLWTALYLRRADPSLRVTLVEAEVAGFGASGRNGGWCSALLPMGLSSMAASAGRDAAIAMQEAMFATVDEVGKAAAEEGIDCHYAKGGYLHLATNPRTPDGSASSWTRPAGSTWVRTTCAGSTGPRPPTGCGRPACSAPCTPRTARPSTRPGWRAAWHPRSSGTARCSTRGREPWPSSPAVCARSRAR